MFHMIEKTRLETASRAHTPYSAILRCALLVLGLIGAEVAWLVALRSLPCHMGYSCLAGLTGN